MTVYVSSPQIPAVLTFEDDTLDEVNRFIRHEMDGYLEPTDEETAHSSPHDFETRDEGGEKLYFLKFPPVTQEYGLEDQIVTIQWSRIASVRVADTAPDRHLPAEHRLTRLPQLPVNTDFDDMDKPILVHFPDE